VRGTVRRSSPSGSAPTRSQSTSRGGHVRRRPAGGRSHVAPPQLRDLGRRRLRADPKRPGCTCGKCWGAGQHDDRLRRTPWPAASATTLRLRLRRPRHSPKWRGGGVDHAHERRSRWTSTPRRGPLVSSTAGPRRLCRSTGSHDVGVRTRKQPSATRPPVPRWKRDGGARRGADRCGRKAVTVRSLHDDWSSFARGSEALAGHARAQDQDQHARHILAFRRSRTRRSTRSGPRTPRVGAEGPRRRPLKKVPPRRTIRRAAGEGSGYHR